MWLFDWEIVWEMLAASGVLMGGYVWLLERRTSLLGCRLYLLSLPLLSALIPLLRIPLWPSREVAVLPLDLEETGLQVISSLLLVPLCVLLFGTTARATQQPAMEELVVKSDVSDELKDSKPAFQGGTEIDFLRWVMGQVHYPADAAEKKISGRVLVQFTVKADGSVDQVKILSAPHDLLAQEVQRVVESSPRWDPALQDGSCVDVRFVLPFDFVL